MLSVESFPQPFPESGFLGVGGDHPTPCNRLEKALGQTDLPSEGHDHKKGAETFHLSCLTPIHRGGQHFEEIELRSKTAFRIV